MISVRSVRKRLGREAVLRGVDLEVRRGEVVALVGPSGTGKSVLLRHIVGLMVPDTGDVLVDGVSISRASAAALARIRRRIGYVFQDGALLDSLTIRENLRLAIPDAEFRRDPAAGAARIGDALRLVNLPAGVLERLPGELSGGMRKRVGVARALLHEPDVILYDEPTTGLDPRNVEIITELVRTAHRRFGATSVVVTHDLASIGRIADRVVLLIDGRVRFDAPPSVFFTTDDPAVRSFIGSAAHPSPEMEPWPAIDVAATS